MSLDALQDLFARVRTGATGVWKLGQDIRYSPAAAMRRGVPALGGEFAGLAAANERGSHGGFKALGAGGDHRAARSGHQLLEFIEGLLKSVIGTRLPLHADEEHLGGCAAGALQAECRA